MSDNEKKTAIANLFRDPMHQASVHAWDEVKSIRSISRMASSTDAATFEALPRVLQMALLSYFGSKKAAWRWMTIRHLALGRRTPLEILNTDGLECVLNELQKLAHGMTS